MLRASDGRIQIVTVKNSAGGPPAAKGK